MKIEKPLVIFDLETTGVDIQRDRIVQFAACRFEPDGSGSELTFLVNPGMHIPAEATEVHGITDADVSDAKSFTTRAGEILDFMAGADIAGYNVLAFDVPLLQAEMRRCGREFILDGRKFIDSLVLFRHFERRDLASALRFYCGADHEDAHDAMADARASTEVIFAQAMRYGQTAEQLAALSWGDRITFDGKLAWDADGHAVLTFGKHAGVPLERVESSYLRWMLGQDFSDEFKSLLRRASTGEVLKRA